MILLHTQQPDMRKELVYEYDSKQTHAGEFKPHVIFKTTQSKNSKSSTINTEMKVMMSFDNFYIDFQFISQFYGNSNNGRILCVAAIWSELNL